MSASKPALTKTWRVGEHFTVTLTVPHLAAGEVACGSCEWSPQMPRELTNRERDEYQAGLMVAMKELTLLNDQRRPL